MATAGNVTDDQRWHELARAIDNLAGQVQSLAEVGGCESVRVAGLEPTDRQSGRGPERAAAACARSPSRLHQESKSLVGKGVVPKRFTKKTSLKQWSRRYKLVAGAGDERFNIFLAWSEAREANSPTVAHEISNVGGIEARAASLRQLAQEHGNRNPGTLHCR